MRNLIMSIVATISGAFCGNATAHEFWIQPESYNVNTGEVLRVSLMHGERFMGDPVTRNNGHIQRFECVGAEGSSEVRGLEGHATSFARPEGSPDQIIVYHSQEYTNLLEANLFNAYLREEGLDEILERRISLDESNEPGREVYSRCAKSLITIGDGAIATDRAVGLPYEIVIQPDGSSGTIRARVLLHDQAAPGVRVVAVCQDQPTIFREATTDEYGTVLFKNASPGPWLLTSLHMERVEDRHDADWRSYWASLTLLIR